MPIKTLYVDAAAENHPKVAGFASRLGLPPTIAPDPAVVYQAVTTAEDPIQAAKEILFLTYNRGAFLKKCPGTRTYTCCDYLILHIGTFCTMDCSYCILQSYFHPPVLRFFLNHDEMFGQLREHFRTKRIARIGTGEFTDSLIWEYWTDFAPRLVAEFAGQAHSVLELKSKTVATDNLKGLPHNRKTILAWSVNTPEIIRSQERGTAALKARLEAAAQMEQQGYPVAFHFDPMVLYPGCEDAYCRVADQIFAHVSPENVVWISLGSFRFMPALKQIIARRFPDSTIPYGEFITGLDGKMRYFKPLRIALYKQVAGRIKSLAPDVLVYYCMEDDNVWRETLGFTPEEQGGLPAMLDRAAMRVCHLAG
jgi:spore photoproduct lyase